MRYKPRSIAALQIALGGLPDRMKVETDRDIGVSAKTVRELRKGRGVAREFSDNNPAGTFSRERNKGEQGERSDARHAKTVSLSSTRVYRQRASSI